MNFILSYVTVKELIQKFVNGLFTWHLITINWHSDTVKQNLSVSIKEITESNCKQYAHQAHVIEETWMNKNTNFPKSIGKKPTNESKPNVMINDPWHKENESQGLYSEYSGFDEFYKHCIHCSFISFHWLYNVQQHVQ